MIDNEREDYIVLRKDLYNKYGLKTGMILQLLISGNGRYVGTIEELSKIIGISSFERVKQNMRALIKLGIVKRYNAKGHAYEYVLVDYTPEEKQTKKKNKKSIIYSQLKAHADAIKKLRNEKYKIDE